MKQTFENLLRFINAAMIFGVNYIFIEKGMITDETIEKLKNCSYSVVVGQGEAARIKISW